ncbi:Zn-dependent hydrolase [Candidatus Acidianus copahuensis]|uniref:Zn-dependent hydrolase n=1 Tax=Candidatus Acidianus copahuensis TaxID=1160895 RepID=A0A031LW34_9CREN|nr:Zn-dependent hydrolase [Candidatus Acidianus copahuensis]EZQ11363.1 Zn-dependent hydrolase [Candidatus Acidianus copahuensis]
MIKSIRIMKVGDHGEVPGPEVFWMREFNSWVKLSFFSFLVNTDDGYLLINTGLPDDLYLRNKFLKEWAGERCRFGFKEEEKVENQLKQIGLSTDDISRVLITPVQDYTIGRINLFNNSKLYFSERGWFEDVVNPRQSPFLNRDIYLPRYVRENLFENAWNRIELIKDGQLLDGLHVKWTGCHHRSSMSIIAEIKGKRICITDSAFVKRNLEENLPIGIAEDIYECINAYAYLKDNCYTIIPAYDSENPTGELKVE